MLSIRIRNDFGRLDLASHGESGQKRPKIEKNEEISCFEVLDVLFWGLKASHVA